MMNQAQATAVDELTAQAKRTRWTHAKPLVRLGRVEIVFHSRDEAEELWVSVLPSGKVDIQHVVNRREFDTDAYAGVSVMKVHT